MNKELSIFDIQLDPELVETITAHTDLQFDRQLVEANAGYIAGLLEGTQNAFERSKQYETVRDSSLAIALRTLWEGLIYYGTGTDPFDSIFSKDLSKEGDQNG